MKPRRRFRSLIKRAGVAITALLLIVGIASGWYGGGASLQPTIGVHAWGGLLLIQCYEPWAIRPQAFGWTDIPIPPPRPDFRLWFGRYRNPSYGSLPSTILVIPFWFLILLTGVPTLLMFRADRRRARIGRCPKCDYSRTGLAADRLCPECGCDPAAVASSDRIKTA